MIDLPSEAERAGSALAASRSLAQGTLSDRAAQCSGDSASGLSTSAFHNTHLALTSFDIAKCMHATFGQRENSMVQGLDYKQLYSHTAHDEYEQARAPGDQLCTLLLSKDVAILRSVERIRGEVRTVDWHVAAQQVVDAGIMTHGGSQMQEAPAHGTVQHIRPTLHSVPA